MSTNEERARRRRQLAESGGSANGGGGGGCAGGDGIIGGDVKDGDEENGTKELWKDDVHMVQRNPAKEDSRNQAH
jgi:hypothetical protein